MSVSTFNGEIPQESEMSKKKKVEEAPVPEEQPKFNKSQLIREYLAAHTETGPTDLATMINASGRIPEGVKPATPQEISVIKNTLRKKEGGAPTGKGRRAGGATNVTMVVSSLKHLREAERLVGREGLLELVKTL